MLRTTFFALTAATALSSPAFADDHGKDIVDTAVEAGSFSTLVAAVEAAGLVETLKGEGPFTVFAPTDEAFAALPEGTVEELLLPENRDRLTQILTYHVVPGEIMSGDISSGEVETVAGMDLTVVAPDSDTSANTVVVGGASVISADVDATNGVIHVIDQVLIPES